MSLTASLLAASVISAALPPMVVTIPEPTRSLPLLARMHGWLGLLQPDVSPDRLRRHAKVLGFDPFDPKTLPSIGVKPNKRIRAWVDATGDVVVIELALKDTKKADAALARVLRPEIPARPVEGASGFVLGSSATTGVAGLRRGDRLFISVGSQSRGLDGSNPLGVLAKLAAADRKNPPPPRTAVGLDDPRLLPILAAAEAKPPSLPPPVTRKRKDADIWVQASKMGRIDRLEGALWLPPTGIEGEWHLHLGVAHDLALSEAVRATARSRTLLAFLDVATQVTANLHFSGIRAVVRRVAPGLPETVDPAKILTGEVHAVLTNAGELVVAAGVGRKVRAKDLGAIARAVRARWPGVKTTTAESKRGDRLALFWFGTSDEAAVKKAVLVDTKKRRAAVEVTSAPYKMPDALSRRSEAQDGVGLPSTQLLLLRLMVQPILNGTKHSQLELQPQSGRVYGKLRADYR